MVFKVIVVPGNPGFYFGFSCHQFPAKRPLDQPHAQALDLFSRFNLLSADPL